MRRLLKLVSASPTRLLIVTAVFVFITVSIDQALKTWALGLIAPRKIFGIQIVPLGNNGIFGGYLADLDPWIARIFFSVLFGFLCIGVALGIHFLKHKDVPFLKIGLVVYCAGIFGNVWDRMTTGTVVDYLVIRVPSFAPMAYNFADFVVFIGFILIIVSIFLEANEFWYARETRRGYWIDSSFQRGFGIWVALVGFAHFFVIALYSFVFLKVFVGPAVAQDRIIRDYLFGLCVIEGAGLILTFGASVIFSHRLIGPLVAFEQFVMRRKGQGLSSSLPPFRVRKSDYFKRILESIADRLGKD